LLAGLHGYYDGSDCLFVHRVQATLARSLRKGRTERLSQVYALTHYDHGRVAPLGRLQMVPICRTGRLGFTPVTSPFAECSAAFGWKRRVHPTQYSRLFLTDWLSSGRVTLNDPSSRASFRNPRDLWLADRFNGDSFPLSSTLFGQLFHRQLLLLTATPIAIKLLGESLTPTSELRCPLLRIVSKGKCLSHPHCRVPCNDEGSMQACPPVSWLGRAGTCMPCSKAWESSCAQRALRGESIWRCF
jgi:hypothetical protein